MNKHEERTTSQAERPGQPAVPPVPAGCTRVAVVQLAYHAAGIRANGRSLLEDPLVDARKLGPDTLLPEKMSSPPSSLRQAMQQLRRHIRAAYASQLERRVEAILAACRSYGAGLVVFPEYSIPCELLGPLARAAPEMVVVAGTHAVESKALDDGIYAQLHAPVSPARGESVCPVLHGGKIIALQPKLNPAPATPERDSMTRGQRWAPIPLPGATDPVSMGILICLDFLHVEGESYRRYVADKIEACGLLVVPSLTPSYTDGEFLGRARASAKGYGRPVLYCNIAAEGNTTILLDDERGRRLGLFPEYIGQLGQGEEGVLIADIRLQSVPSGKSTRYTEPPLLVPVAAASFVYQSILKENDYALWLDQFNRIADSTRENEPGGGRELAAHVLSSEALLSEVARHGIRKTRLSLLLDTIENAPNIEQLRKLTREIVLPPGILPLAELRAAMARGAAAVVRSWRDRTDEDLHPFAEVEATLRRAQRGAVSLEQMVPPGRAAVAEVEKCVGGDALRVRTREATAIVIQAYEAAAERGFDAEDRNAKEALRAGRDEEARGIFLRMMEQAEKVVAADPDNQGMRERAARCRLNAAACALNLQELDEGKALLALVDAEALPAEARCVLAEALAFTGNLDRAKSVLPEALPELPEKTRKRLQDAQQILVLRAGEMPANLSPRAAVQREAAELLLERDDFIGAAEAALRALQEAADQALTTASALSILIAALRRSLFEDPPNARLIPLDARERCVQAIEAALGRLDFAHLPEGIRRHVEPWRRMYLGMIVDIEAIEVVMTNDEPEFVGPSSEPSATVRGRAIAGKLAGEGKLEEAFAALPPTDHPWLDRYYRVELTAIAGQMDRALADARTLAQEVPGRGPIAYQVAALLHNEGRAEDALPYARQAFEALPGKGQRLLLGRCLFASGRAELAWSVLEPLRGSQHAGILLSLAQVADAIAPREAPLLWQRYLRKKPNDGAAKIRRAQALFKLDERQQAAQVAWEALRQHQDDLSADRIFAAGTLQKLRGELEEEYRERIQRAADILHRRFPADPQAEVYRFQLLTLLGGNGEVQAAPIDFALIGQSGRGELVPLEELLDRLQKIQSSAEAAFEFYQSGGLPFWGYCRVTGERLPTALLRVLRSTDQIAGLLCAPASLPSTPLPQTLEGETILISDLELFLLAHLELLSRLRERLGTSGRLALMRGVQHRIIDDATQVEAIATGEQADAKLARTVQQFVARGLREGFIQLVDAPLDARELPPLREPKQAWDDDLVLAPIREHLAVRTLMDQRSTWWRVTADFWGTELLGAIDAIRCFAWPNDGAFLAMSAWNRELAARDLRLPDLVRLLIEPPRVDKPLRRLAELGFPDALGAGEILRLERRYEGLDKPEPARLLERMEWMARAPGHIGGEMARWRLAGNYAASIWTAYCGETSLEIQVVPVTEVQPPAVATPRTPLPDLADAASLARALLMRAESIDEPDKTRVSVHGPLLDQILFLAVGTASSSPLAFMKQIEKELMLDESRRGHAFFRSLYDDWAAGNPTRRAALGRAVQAVLAVLDQLRPEGPLDFEIAPFCFCSPALIGRSPDGSISLGRRSRGGISLDEPESEAFAILSAHWKEKAFAGMTITLESPGKVRTVRVTLREVLNHGGAILGHSTEVGGDDRTWRYPFPVTDGPQLDIYAPVEAILLRAETEVRGVIAAEWAGHQGLHDGRAHDFLYRIAKSPDDVALQREYARFTVTAPWRLVRDDPAFFLRFSEWRPFTARSRVWWLEDLRNMLSEPGETWPDGGSFAETFAERARSSEGQPASVWGDRLDKRALFLQASAVPGNLPITTLGTRLHEPVFIAEVQSALDRLNSPDEHPIAQLAGDFCFLRVAATRKPVVRLRKGDVDLRQELPDVAVRLLDSVLPPILREDSNGQSRDTTQAPAFGRSPAMTLASVEGALLRVCRQIVDRVSRRSGGLPVRDFLWLTYRLYQWLVAQLELIGPDERREGLRRIAQAAEPASTNALDLLDPIHFSPNIFDHRLATVLYTFRLAEELLLYAKSEGAAPAEEPLKISSAALEERLIQLGSRPPHGRLDRRSVLDWNASGEIPDLALIALLQRNLGAFVRLSPEARLRWISSLPTSFPPETPERPDFSRMLTRTIIMAACDAISELTIDEKKAFELRLREMEAFDQGQWRDLGLISLFGPDAPHLEDEARALVLNQIEANVAPMLLERFITAIGRLHPDRFESEVTNLRERIESMGAAQHVGLLIVGLTRVILHGPSTLRGRARDMLVGLAKLPSFVEDPQIEGLLRYLGLKGETS